MSAERRSVGLGTLRGAQTKPNNSFCWTIMVSRVRNQRLCCYWRPPPSCSTETTLHPLSTLIPTLTIRFQHQSLLNVTLLLHVAVLVLVALFLRALMVMVPTAIVDPIEAHLLTVVALLHPGVLLRPQLFVLLPHLDIKKGFLCWLFQEGAQSFQRPWRVWIEYSYSRTWSWRGI